MQITIYSTTTCPYCNMLKDYLTAHNIAFQEKHVDTDETHRDEMLAISGGFLGVPFTTITKEDGSRENVIGFDKGKLKQILNIEE